MKLGFFASNYSQMTLEEVAQTIYPYGYRAIEIPSYIGNGQMDCDEIIKENNAKQLVQMLEGYDITISALANHVDSVLIGGPWGEDTDRFFKGSKEEKIKYGTESLIKSAQAANALEVPVVNCFTGVENWSRFFPFPSLDGWEKQEQEFVELFMPILEKFREYGVKMAVEPHPNNIVYDIQSAKRAVELLDGHPNFGYNLDPANLAYLGLRVENFIDQLADRIFHVHAKDGELVAHNVQMGGALMQGDWQRLDRSFRFRIPGWGDTPWKKVITELSLIGYDYVMSYEHEDVTMSIGDGVEKVADYLLPLLIKAPYEGRKDKVFHVGNQ